MGFKTRCCSFLKLHWRSSAPPSGADRNCWTGRGWKELCPLGAGAGKRGEGRGLSACGRRHRREGTGVRTSLAQLSVQRSRGRSDVGDVCPCSVWEAPGNFPAPPSAPLATGARGSWVHFPEKHLQRSQSYETTGRGPLSCRASVPLPFLVLAKGTVSSDTLQGMG